jgi:hypothetical protein
VRLEASLLVLSANDGWEERWPLESLTAIQPSSSALQLRARGHTVISVRFLAASVLLWEHWLQEAVRRRYHALGKGEIAEFQPRISLR